jgi:hypothetical protein
LIQDIPQLCSTSDVECFFGYDGDIEPFDGRNAISWSERLVNGSAVAERLLLGWKMRELSRLVNYMPVCGQLISDSQLVMDVEARSAEGSQLAIVLNAWWQACRLGARPAEVAPSRARAVQLAEAGYEPAQFYEAAMIQMDLAPKFISRKSPDDPLLVSDSDRQEMIRAEKYLRNASSHNWSAASMMLFDWCRTKILACNTHEMDRLLTVAVSEGQRDALRTAAIAHIIGEGGQALQKFGFSRARNFTRSLSYFSQAASPAANASKNTAFLSYDNVSAGYLAYFYWGGRYDGQVVTTPNVILAQQYGQQCLGGSSGPSPLLEFCGMIDAVGRFNRAPDALSRRGIWAFIQQFSGWAPIAGELARNLATWSQDGSDIRVISCDLNEELSFGPSRATVALGEGMASCYRQAGG